jgi:hypothetical protein
MGEFWSETFAVGKIANSYAAYRLKYSDWANSHLCFRRKISCEDFMFNPARIAPSIALGFEAH